MAGTETEEQGRTSAIQALDADPSSRKRFLKAVGGTAAAGAFAAFLSACGSSASTQTTAGGSNVNTAAGTGTDIYGKGDLGIARFLINLEFIAVDFYDAALASGNLKGRASEIAKTFADQERQHEAALKQLIGRFGGDVPARPKANFATQTSSSILKQAADLEGLAAATLLGQAGRIEDKEFLAGALRMHSVEGRHAAAIHELMGDDPAPQGAFAKPVFASDVLNQLHSLTASG